MGHCYFMPAKFHIWQEFAPFPTERVYFSPPRQERGGKKKSLEDDREFLQKLRWT